MRWPGLIVLLLAAQAGALPARRLMDLRTLPRPTGSGPRDFTTFNGALVFTASDGTRQRLWRTDGTLLGTVIADELASDVPNGFSGQLFGVVGGRLLMGGFDDLEGSELWSISPTEGLRSLALVPGEHGASPGNPFVVGNQLFMNSFGTSARRLMVSDGTPAGTRFLDGAPAWGDGAALGALFVFAAFEPVRGQELYVSDGTPAGTTLLREFRAGSTGGAYGTVTLGSKVLFVGDDGVTGFELWETDGTLAGTRLVKDVNPGAPQGVLGRPVVAGATAWFIGTDAAGRELWRSDGTTAGTTRVADLNPAGDSSLNLGPPTPSGLFFVTYTAPSDVNLMFTDGTAAGTVLLQTFAGASIDLTQARFAGGRCYLNVRAGSAPPELWSSDGTPAGTARLTTSTGYSPAPSTGFTAAAAGVVFAAEDPVFGNELWVTEGLPGTTRLLANLSPERASSYALISGLVGGKAALWFYGDDGGFSLAATDGTESGTTISGTGAATSFVAEGAELGDDYVFFCGAPSLAVCVARGDGGVEALPSALVSPYFSAMPYRFGSRVFFSGASGSGVEPWFFDGADAGQLADLGVPGSSTPSGFATLGDRLLFTCWPSFGDPAVCVSDGTSAGTSRIASFPNTRLGSSITIAGDAGLFVLEEAATGGELWRTDGTASGTRRLLDLNPGAAGSNAEHFLSFGAEAYFAADDGVHGSELWRSDGTTAGTYTLGDVRPGPVGSGPYPLAKLGERLLFRADDGVTGYELWVANRADGGMTRLTDAWPGRASGVSSAFGPVGDGGWLVLVAGDTDAGLELWKTDGTPEGTSLVEDLAPGPASSRPGNFQVIQGRLLFTATDATGDHEPWVVPLDDAFFDRTPPSIQPVLQGPLGANGLYTGPVQLSWLVTDDVSPIQWTLGCDAQRLASDQALQAYRCTARSVGGEASAVVEVGIDLTPPALRCPADLEVLASSPSGATASWVVEPATDAQSSPVQEQATASPGDLFPVGDTVVTRTATDAAGNTASCAFHVRVASGADARRYAVGCGCHAGGGPAWLLLALALGGARRTRGPRRCRAP